MSDLEELRVACQKADVGLEAEKIAGGEPMWLTGRPARSGEGIIALAIDDLTILIQEPDVQDVQRVGERFRVKVRAGTDMLFRLERVAQARAAPPCDRGRCVGHEASPRAANIDIEIGPVTVCKTFTACLTVFGKEYCIDVPYDCHVETILT